MKIIPATLPLLVVLLFMAAGCGGTSDRSAKIGAAIGGDCTATQYEIISRLDSSKERIYDCLVGSKELCVTEANGIASDVTATAKLLFANSLSGGKPDCAA